MLVELRSDTFTRPTPALRQAMFQAEVGDDVWGEDPTCNLLEARSAAMLGKEAALFTTTGTMANGLAIRLLTEPGDEILMHAMSHPFHHEAGAPAAISGTTIRPLDGERGMVDLSTLKSALRQPARHMSRQRLFWIEDTHNAGGGAVQPLDLIRETSALAHDAGLSVHIDGARIFNASVASEVDVATISASADTVSFCMSKGLGAPVGSMLCGPRDLIEKGRRFRHMLGGGWRQAGFLAGAGLYALEHHVNRLADDHRWAKMIRDAVTANPRLRLLLPVETNMVMFAPKEGGPASADVLVSQLAEHGVLTATSDPGVVRAVTHLGVGEDGALYASEIIAKI